MTFSNRVAVDVKAVFVPKEYNPKKPCFQRTTADIAILKLNKDLDIEGNPNLEKVKLPEKEETYAGKKAIISGFGYNEVDVVKNPKTRKLEEKNGKRFDKMRFAEADLLSHEECEKYYTLVKVTENHICAAVGSAARTNLHGFALVSVVAHSSTKAPKSVNKVVGGKIDDNIRSTTLKIGD